MKKNWRYESQDIHQEVKIWVEGEVLDQQDFKAFILVHASGHALPWCPAATYLQQVPLG